MAFFLSYSFSYDFGIFCAFYLFKTPNFLPLFIHSHTCLASNSHQPWLALSRQHEVSLSDVRHYPVS